MNDLSRILKAEAVSLGLCKKWTKEWRDNHSEQELIEKYIKGIDFCILNDYPSNEFIKANFDRRLLSENLIFVDECLDLDNAPSGIYILNGHCTGTITFREWSAATVYVRHSSYVTINSEPFSKVFVRVYDEAEVSCNPSGDSVCRLLDRR